MTIQALEWDVLKYLIGAAAAAIVGVVSGITRAYYLGRKQANRASAEKAEKDANRQEHTTLDGKIKVVRDDLEKKVGAVEEMTVRAHRRIEAHDVDLVALKTSSMSLEKRLDQGFRGVDARFVEANQRFTEVNDSIQTLTTAVMDALKAGNGNGKGA